MKRLQIPQKFVYEKFYKREKKLCTRNCRRKFIKNFLPEKRKEDIQTKQPRFKSWLKQIIWFKFVKSKDFKIVLFSMLNHYPLLPLSNRGAKKSFKLLTWEFVTIDTEFTCSSRLENNTTQKMKFSIKDFFSKCADLVKFTEEKLNEKLHFLCNELTMQFQRCV